MAARFHQKPYGCTRLINMVAHNGSLRGMFRVILLFTVICLFWCNAARAQLGASENQLTRLLGSPVKSYGDLIYFHKPPRNYVIRMYEGACDQICVFSDCESRGFPEPLSDQGIEAILHELGGATDWSPVNRLSMNRIWSSQDRKCFAIYETIYNKLVLMTREAYRRDRSSKP